MEDNINHNDKAKEAIALIKENPTHKWLIKTGERGLFHFLRALHDENNALTIPTDITAVSDTRSIWLKTENSSGVVATITVDPHQDDYRCNKLVYPDGSLKESYIYYLYKQQIKI